MGIDGMAETLPLGDSEDSTWKTDAAGALAAGIRDELIKWKCAKEKEFEKLCKRKLRVWENLVKSEEEEYENEASIWALHRKKLLRELENMVSDSERNFRKRKGKA